MNDATNLTNLTELLEFLKSTNLEYVDLEIVKKYNSEIIRLQDLLNQMFDNFCISNNDINLVNGKIHKSWLILRLNEIIGLLNR